MLPLRLLLVSFALGSLVSHVSGQSLYCFAEEATLEDLIGGSDTGGSVAIDGDTVICGDDNFGSSGAVSIYRRHGGTWTQEASISDPPGTFYGEEFGHSVDISGDVAVIGAWLGDDTPYGPRGCAYVYTRTGSTWAFTQILTNQSLGEYSFMGADVAVSGNTMAVSADWAGKVMIYVWDGSSWVEQATIGPNGQYFGWSIALEEGSPQSTLIVGAARASVGGFSDAGAAYAYVGNGGNWNLQGTFTGGPLAADRYFGNDVSVSGDTTLIGASNAAIGTIRSGAAFVYRRTNQTWQLEQKLVPNQPRHGDGFGTSVSIDAHQAVISVPGEDEISNNHGNAYFFYRVGTTWSAPEPMLPEAALASYPIFGRFVALAGDTVATGNGIGTGVFVPKTRVGTAYCHCTTGPCGNGDAGAGCANSTGQGAELSAQGSAAGDDVDLIATGAVPGVFGIFFEGQTSIQAPFGDGHLCTGGTIIRLVPLPTQVSPDGTAMYGPCFGGPTIPSVTGIVPGSGQIGRYQFWYRDPSGPCGGGFNTSNGLEIVW